MTETPAQHYDISGVQLLLPHRYPFLLVDRIDVIEPGKHVVGIKRLTSGEWWARDGGVTGSGKAELPFSLLIEALAQAGGALIRDLTGGVPGSIAYFMGADRVRMRGAARVGDELRFDVTLKQWRRGICRTRARASVDGRALMTAELTTIVRPG
ncbi:MAG TPA: 3-hydroxyacyl-ACP dehydratase FabZ family protein [Gemmatimonadaceae bacterium]|jgi:3-hydroxyacyl-[acyl-carrier-protein] dehydratase